MKARTRAEVINWRRHHSSYCNQTDTAVKSPEYKKSHWTKAKGGWENQERVKDRASNNYISETEKEQKGEKGTVRDKPGGFNAKCWQEKGVGGNVSVFREFEGIKLKKIHWVSQSRSHFVTNQERASLEGWRCKAASKKLRVFIRKTSRKSR